MQDIALEQEFFSALIAQDTGALERILAEDFTLADLMGSLVSKKELLSMVKTGNLRFLSIVPHDPQERFYADTGIITGRTTMTVRFNGNEMTFESRYTHVFASQDGQRRMVAGQGTPIQAPPS